jgi:hypothetical protein
MAENIKIDVDAFLKTFGKGKFFNVYWRVFDEAWVRRNVPANVPLKIAVAAATTVLTTVTLWYMLLFPAPYVDTLETASSDVPYSTYEALKPFHRSRADELFAQFWERRGDRDQAILVRASAGGGGGLARLARLAADYSN